MKPVRQLFISVLIGSAATGFGQTPELSEEAAMKAEMALIDGQKYMILENYARALELFQKAAEINPHSGTIYYKIAQIHFENESYDLALLNIDKALELDDANLFFYELAADIHLATSNFEDAQKLYERLIELGGKEDAYGELATIYLYQGKDNKALGMLSRAQDRYGTNEEIVNKKQQILLKQGRVDDVIDEWRRLATVYPNEPRYMNRLLELLLDFDRFSEADSLVDQLPMDGIQKNDFLINRALILLKGNQLKKSLETATPALLSRRMPFEKKGSYLQQLQANITTTAPVGMVEVLDSLGNMHRSTYRAQALVGDLFYQLGNLDKALVYYKRAQEIDGSDYGLWENILQIQLVTYRYDSLIQWGELALEYYPNQSSIYYFLGCGYLERNDLPKARTLLTTGKRYQRDPGRFALFDAQLGYWSLLNDDLEEAQRLFESAVKQEAAKEIAWDRWSQGLALKKLNLKKAGQLVDQLLKIRPNHPRYLARKGKIVLLNGELEKAKSIYEEALSAHQTGTLLEGLGDVWLQLGDEAQAIAYWQRAAGMPDVSQSIKEKIADPKLYE